MPLSTLIVVAANLVPLAGVVFWGWDVFVLLILYWLETAVIGFWTIMRLLLVSEAGSATLGRMAGPARVIGRGFQAVFITVHAGIFMTVHFLFLWTLFAGAWADVVHGPIDFVRVLVIGTGLWLPLLFLFLVRGWFVLRDVVLGSVDMEGDVLSGLYIRIVVMQFAIILGGWLAQLTGGGTGTLILLVIGKTGVELYAGRLSGKVDAATAKAAAERDPAA
ncbi:MAG TPA: DUF6498-containing protein [Bauldia sp.]|nr:DUF6498-containing protein [Bauldia sp.]